VNIEDEIWIFIVNKLERKTVEEILVNIEEDIGTITVSKEQTRQQQR